MFNETHNLVDEFPEYKDRIHHLKMEDRHFARLFDEYHDVDQQLHRVDVGLDVHADEVVEEMKKVRLHLKDELYAMLRATQ